MVGSRRLRAGIPIVASTAILGGCDIGEALIDALTALGGEPRLVYAAMVPVPGDPQGTLTAALYGAAIGGADQGVNLRRAFPFDDRYAEVLDITWHDGGQKLGVTVYEPFGTIQFDRWVSIYDRDLDREFHASDDVIGGQVQAACAPFDAGGLQAFVDDVILQDGLPEESLALSEPGQGTILSAAFEGWLAETRFLASLEIEPDVYVLLPDGSRSDILDSVGISSLGEFRQVYVTYVYTGAAWSVEGCDLAPAPIPARRAPVRTVTISDGSGSPAQGDLLLDGAPLLSLTGEPLAGTVGAEVVDGPY